jgi:tRNA 2-thiocytidine biosynthesis protein TtcA
MSLRFFRKTDVNELVKKLVVKNVMERSLISKDDRVLIAVSGGKDSSVLAWALSSIRQALKFNYELSAVHISTDFCSCCGKRSRAGRLDEWGVPFTDLFVPVTGRLKEGKNMNCYWCSTQRRVELIKYALENGFNKIALGHHLDDIIETFFMNLCGKGVMLAMPVTLKYRKYPLTLIRPLALLEEKQIIACVARLNILKTACTCPYGQNSKRREIRGSIAAFTGGKNPGETKRRILKALAGGKVDYLSDA